MKIHKYTCCKRIIQCFISLREEGNLSLPLFPVTFLKGGEIIVVGPESPSTCLLPIHSSLLSFQKVGSGVTEDNLIPVDHDWEVSADAGTLPSGSTREQIRVSTWNCSEACKIQLCELSFAGYRALSIINLALFLLFCLTNHCFFYISILQLMKSK